MTLEHTPYETGLGVCVKLGKGDFQGREALLRQRAEGVTRKLCCLVLAQSEAIALGNEPVFHNEQLVSRVTSGGYGFTVRESIAYTYLDTPLTTPGTTMDVEVDGRRIPATCQSEPRFDPREAESRPEPTRVIATFQRWME